MSGIPTDRVLKALTAIVNRETVELSMQLQRYGEFQWNPNTPAKAALNAALESLGWIEKEKHDE